MTADTDVFFVGGPDVAWRQTGDEIVVLDRAGAVYFGLNRTGARLWTVLTTGASRTDLLRHLAPDPARHGPDLRSDIDAFLADLDEFGLLHRAPAQRSAGTESP